MSTEGTNHKQSKLSQFKLDFEYNRTLRDERKITRQRRDDGSRS